MLATETQMFQKFCKRIEPKLETSHGSNSRQASTSLANASSYPDIAGSRIGGRKRSKSRASNLDRSLRLTAEQKCEIAQRELEEYTEEMRMANEDSEKHVDELKVSLLIMLVNCTAFTGTGATGLKTSDTQKPAVY